MAAVTWPELIGAVSLACDIGMALPLETGLGASVVAVGLAERLGLDDNERQRAFDLALLEHVGCTAAAPEVAPILGDEMIMREHAATLDFSSKAAFGKFMFGHVARVASPAHRPATLLRLLAGAPRIMATAAGVCEAAQFLGSCYGASDATIGDLAFVYESWKGTGVPNGVKGDAIPVPVQIVQVAALATIVANAEGPDAATALLRERRGGQLSPAVVDTFAANAHELLSPLAGDVWDAMCAAAPSARPVTDDQLDDALAGIGDFVDLKAPCLIGHSRGVAALAANAAKQLGASETDARLVRRAGWVHDVGRAAVSSAIWQKPNSLTADQREKVRLHSYYTGRVLDRVAGLRDIAAVAVCHHERLDGSGYHAGTKAAALSELARVLAAADAFHAMTEERPYRAARSADAAAKELDLEVAAGRIDARAADAVKAAAGLKTKRKEPTELTAREIDILRLVARGLSIKQMATELSVSPKTVDGHLQRIYPKIGVSTRTGATLYALQNGVISP